MEMKTYWQSLPPAEKKTLAARCRTSVAYLAQVANRHRLPGRNLCFALERETKRVVSIYDLRPDWFGPIAPYNGPEHRAGADRRYGERRAGERRHTRVARQDSCE